jgi:hypothetical protein
MVEHIHHETALHIDYCKGFGITKAEMEASEESQGKCTPTKEQSRLTVRPSLHCIYTVDRSVGLLRRKLG